MNLPNNWQESYFTAFPDVVFIKGEEDAAAYDFGRLQLVPVPQALCDVVEALEDATCGEFVASLPADQQDLVQPYLSFLLRKDFGTLRKDKIAFQPLSREWDQSNELLGAQIELNRHSDFNPHDALRQITDRDCFQLEIRLADDWTSTWAVENLLEGLRGTTLRAVNIYLASAAGWTMEDADELFARHPKLLHLLGYGATAAGEKTYRPGMLRLTTDPQPAGTAERNHYEGRYIVNYRYFTEALQYNPLLNRRVSVSEFGYWKNDLAYDRTFGHVAETPLSAVLNDPDFTALWRVNADRIIELKDSARRYAVWPAAPLSPLADGSGLYTFSNSPS